MGYRKHNSTGYRKTQKHSKRIKTRRIVLPIVADEQFVLLDELSGSNTKLNIFESLNEMKIAFEVPNTIRIKTERRLMQ